MVARLLSGRAAVLVVAWMCVGPTVVKVDAVTRTLSMTSVELATSAEAAVASLIGDKSPGHHRHGHRHKLRHAEHAVEKTVNLTSAAASLGKRLDKLPPAISAFVRSGKSEGDFSEASIDKARKVINGMVSEAWTRLDKTIVECQEFHDQNRQHKSQIDADLAQLGDQIADLKGERGGAVSGVQQIEQQIVEVKDKYKEEVQRRQDQKMSDNFEKRMRSDDLSVATFIMKLTKCTSAASSSNSAPAFLQKSQLRRSRSSAQIATSVEAARKSPVKGVRLCQTDGSSGLELRFDDPELQRQLETKMTQRARQMLQQALAGGAFAPPVPVSLLQRRSQDSDDDSDDSADSDTQDGQEDDEEAQDEGAPDDSQTSTQTLTVTEAPIPVDVAPSRNQHRKCPLGKVPDCALLHDSTSLIFGDMQDAYDEITMKIARDDKDHQNTLDDYNRQIETLRDQKGSLNEQMAGATSSMNSAEMQRQQKDQELEDVEHEFNRKTKQCKAEIHEILYSEVCGYKCVRAAVVKQSTVLKSEDIADCEFTDWMPGDCSKPCDDSCGGQQCGGITTLTRDVIQKPNQYGVKCPALTYTSMCNQVKCPVDCALSMWSGFSKCTKECEGGVRQRTRSVLQTPRRGGEQCDTVSETDSCNTGSCDRDCTLDDWTAWLPCTAACGGGTQQRHRHVLIPMRGSGECPVDWSKQRLEQQVCNDQKCVGDEVCIAKQDLIIAIDGSGSISEDGFKTLRSFASALVARYKTTAYGGPAMKVGVVEFGNGEVLDDGSVSRAIDVHALGTDVTAVKTSIDGMSFLKGFTNMAQAFQAAQDSWRSNGRMEARSVVLVITDGKPSFKYQTEQKVQQILDQGAQIFMVPVSLYDKGDSIDFMKKLASKPVESNFLHIPGLDELKTKMDYYTTKLLTQSCPRTSSAKQTAYWDKRNGFSLLVEGKKCGKADRAVLGRGVRDPNSCAALANAQGLSFFGLGQYVNAGTCYAETAPSSDCPAGFETSGSDFYQIVS